MANGCIVGKCPVCGEWMYEDEWDMTGDIMHHEDCEVTKFVTKFAKLPIERQKQLLELGEITIKLEQTKELAKTILGLCEDTIRREGTR